jgi:hypothetical protein
MNEIAIANRPTAQHISGLFTQYGITPTPYLFLFRPMSGSCLGCAIGALLVEAIGSVDAAFNQRFDGDALEILVRLREWPGKFLTGLDHGFSYASSSTEGQRLWNRFHHDPLYVDGIDIGRAVRALVLPDQPRESSNA